MIALYVIAALAAWTAVLVTRTAVLEVRLSRFKRLVRMVETNMYAHLSVRRVLSSGSDWVQSGRDVYSGDDCGDHVCEAESQSDAARIVNTVNALRHVHQCLGSAKWLRKASR